MHCGPVVKLLHWNQYFETIDAIVKAFTMGFHNSQVRDMVAHKFLVCNAPSYHMLTYDTYVHRSNLVHVF